MSFTSMLSDMDPEVAKTAIQQFPDFAKTALEIMKNFKESINKSLENNSKSMCSFNTNCEVEINGIKELLATDILSFDEKNIVIDKMINLLQMQADKDSENKKFHLKTVAVICTMSIGMAGILASVLGSNANVHNKSE